MGTASNRAWRRHVELVVVVRGGVGLEVRHQDLSGRFGGVSGIRCGGCGMKNGVPTEKQTVAAARTAAWRLNNPEKYAACKKVWAVKYRATNRASSARWKAAHPVQARALQNYQNHKRYLEMTDDEKTAFRAKNRAYRDLANAKSKERADRHFAGWDGLDKQLVAKGGRSLKQLARILGPTNVAVSN